ncbi:PAS domain S-box-containing protein [Filimonas lacunae]|uniref:histidine kinase n=1 Tax=Filimonas lacunae TaxID=477680 RepID=A0A173MPP0_9BACT|nr:PAS domain-containing protein [Filimonas lacunae]BAV09456.1 sensor histidine kinase [Filimonas lacunae]SIS73481.1 PAS domain S-box-containing protein [Filimonas lacunae]
MAEKLSANTAEREEQLRLQAVKIYRHGKHNWQNELQEMVVLAASITGAPVVFLSIIDDAQQYLIASQGCILTTIAKELSPCVQIIQQQTILISNKGLPPHHPFTQTYAPLPFYAGIPLTTAEGYIIGSLCIMDTTTRQLTPQEVVSLQAIARQAMEIMNNAIHLQYIIGCKEEMAEAAFSLRSVLDNSPTFQILVNTQMEILAFNAAANEFVKFAIGKGLQQGENIIHYSPPSSISSLINSFNRALSGERVYGERQLNYDGGVETWWDVVYSPVRSSKGDIVGVAFNATDITSRKQNEQKLLVQNEKLKEIAQIQSHQVRGPLTSILGILSLIKEDNYQASTEYLLLLEKAAIQMDENIRRIVTLNRKSNA